MELHSGGVQKDSFDKCLSWDTKLHNHGTTEIYNVRWYAPSAVIRSSDGKARLLRGTARISDPPGKDSTRDGEALSSQYVRLLLAPVEDAEPMVLWPNEFCEIEVRFDLSAYPELGSSPKAFRELQFQPFELVSFEDEGGNLICAHHRIGMTGSEDDAAQLNWPRSSAGLPGPALSG